MIREQCATALKQRQTIIIRKRREKSTIEFSVSGQARANTRARRPTSVKIRAHPFDF
jgi:hypothetical protein